MKMCIACGMPMTQIGDYAKFDITKNYCKYCANPDGSMKSFEDKLESTAKRYTTEHNMSYDDAKEAAYVILKKLPAWKKKW